MFTTDVTDPEDYSLYDLIDTKINSTRHYMQLMYSLVRANDLKTLVELGCYRGNTTAILARAAKKNGGHVWAIDNNLDGDSLELTLEHLISVGLADVVTLVKSDSWSPQEPKCCDFVFIDAQHDIASINKDWYAWSPRITNGGFVAAHDVTGSELAYWVADTFPMPGWEHILLPGDHGLLLARRTGC